MFDNLREDLRRYGTTPVRQFKAALGNPGIWATVSYRFRRWVHTADLPRPLKLPLKLAAVAVNTGAVAVTSIQLPETVSIGPGLYIPHAGYVVLAGNVVIGRHCCLTQGVTIGNLGGSSPVIGDRVYVGPGSVLLGDITIGDDVLIGAATALRQSLPARAVAVGNPAKVVSRRGSFTTNSYPGMESDPARDAALATAAAEAAATEVTGRR